MCTRNSATWWQHLTRGNIQVTLHGVDERNNSCKQTGSGSWGGNSQQKPGQLTCVVGHSTWLQQRQSSAQAVCRHLVSRGASHSLDVGLHDVACALQQLLHTEKKPTPTASINSFEALWDRLVPPKNTAVAGPVVKANSVRVPALCSSSCASRISDS